LIVRHIRAACDWEPESGRVDPESPAPKLLEIIVSGTASHKPHQGIGARRQWFRRSENEHTGSLSGTAMLVLLCLRIPTLYNAHLDYYEAVHRINDELRDVAVAHLIDVSLCKSL
jgi:hypothetical protein